jgi:carbonic anhydrase/acetyltransferase-like protein (isoleucine patch superfamily)
MALLTRVRDKSPLISNNTFLAPGAQIIGDVSIGEGSSIWYNVVLRGDVMPIKIGRDSNIQDGTVVHGTFNKCGAVIGDRVTVGHSAILHGCELGDECFVGMGALVMDMCKVAPRTMIGAGAMLTENTVTKEGWLYLGRPAKAVRLLTDDELKFLKQSAENYKFYKTWYEDAKILNAGPNPSASDKENV